jgi:hypothetical protein
MWTVNTLAECTRTHTIQLQLTAMWTKLYLGSIYRYLELASLVVDRSEAAPRGNTDLRVIVECSVPWCRPETACFVEKDESANWLPGRLRGDACCCAVMEGGRLANAIQNINALDNRPPITIATAFPFDRLHPSIPDETRRHHHGVLNPLTLSSCMALRRTLLWQS